MTQFKEEINHLSKTELVGLYKELMKYRTLSKDLGLRGQRKFHQIHLQEKQITVEYYSVLDKDFVEEQALEMLKEVFKLENISKDKIVYKPLDKVLGGMRIFVDDQVLDLSFLNIERKLYK